MKQINNLVFLLALLICSSANAQKPQFHALIFSCTNDSNIGESCAVDNDNVIMELTTIASAIGYQFDLKNYVDNDCNPQKVNETIRNLIIGPNDIVFFYYTGHGGRYDTDDSDYPRMCLNQMNAANWIPVDEVDQKLSQKNPLLRVVIADCCNSVSAFMPKGFGGTQRGSTTVTVTPEINYRKLFLNVKGNILAAACKRNETAVGFEEDGGAFTTILLACMQAAVDGKINCDWKTIFNVSSDVVTDEMAKLKPESHEQHPIYFVNASPIGSITPNNNSPIAPPLAPVVPPVDTTLYNQLMHLIDPHSSVETKLGLTTVVLNKYFNSSSAYVDVIGRDNKTIVDQDCVGDFLQRIALSSRLLNFAILKQEKDPTTNKLTHLVVHEVCKE
jgi:hypothetical protein